MGLLAKLLLLPITAPAYGLEFIVKQIKERVDAEQLDEGLVEEELMTLSLRLEMGEIDDAAYMEQETELLERLNAIRAYKESLSEGSDGDADDGDADAPEPEQEVAGAGRATALEADQHTPLTTPTTLRVAS